MAAPLPSPWPDAEQALVDLRPAMADAAMPAEAQQQPPAGKAVVAIHEGQGHIAWHGYAQASWVPGRLWTYADGSCGFVWLLEPHLQHLVDYDRLADDDL
jgi:hypothetical protein